MIIEMARPELPVLTVPVLTVPVLTVPVQAVPVQTNPVLTVTEFAEILFATSLQESDAPSPVQAYEEVCRSWLERGGDCAPFVARLAQEAGDHPEEAARRMRWARDTAERAVGAVARTFGAAVPQPI